MFIELKLQLGFIFICTLTVKSYYLIYIYNILPGFSQFWIRVCRICYYIIPKNMFDTSSKYGIVTTYLNIYEPGMAGNFISIYFFSLWLNLTPLLLFFSPGLALACPFAAWGKNMPVCSMHEVKPRAEGSNKGLL